MNERTERFFQGTKQGFELLVGYSSRPFLIWIACTVVAYDLMSSDHVELGAAVLLWASVAAIAGITIRDAIYRLAAGRALDIPEPEPEPDAEADAELKVR